MRRPGLEHDDRAFWTKVARFAFTAGRELVLTALTLWECVHDRRTPEWARATIVAALGYFVLPLDTIPDLVPAVGFTDDMGILLAALATVAAYVRPQHRAAARARLRFWFSEPQASA